MFDAPENIGLVRGMLGLRLWNKHDDNDQSNAIAYTRSDLVAELAAENERLTKERDEAERLKINWFVTHLAHQEANQALGKANSELFKRAMDAERRIEALSHTGAVKEAGAELAKAVFGVDLDTHPRDTNTVDAHETANVSDKPEGHQEPVAAWQRRVLYPENGAKPQWEQCSATEATDQFARSPHHEYRPLFTRPSEQAVTEAGKGLLRIVEEIDGAMKHGTWRDEKGMRLKDTPEWVVFYNALKAAMEAGR